MVEECPKFIREAMYNSVLARNPPMPAPISYLWASSCLIFTRYGTWIFERSLDLICLYISSRTTKQVAILRNFATVSFEKIEFKGRMGCRSKSETVSAEAHSWDIFRFARHASRPVMEWKCGMHSWYRAGNCIVLPNIVYSESDTRVQWAKKNLERRQSEE